MKFSTALLEKYIQKGMLHIDAAIVDELQYQGYGDAKRIVEIGKSRPIVQWVLKMQDNGLHLDTIADYKNEFDRYKKDRLTGKTDITQVTYDEVENYLAQESYKEEQKGKIEQVFSRGSFVVWKAETPEALSYFCKNPEFGENSWCIKGLGWAETYSRPKGTQIPAYIILKNNQFFAAKVGRELKDDMDHNFTSMDELPSEEQEDFISVLDFIVNDDGLGWGNSGLDAIREQIANESLQNWNLNRLEEVATPRGGEYDTEVISWEFTKKLLGFYKKTRGKQRQQLIPTISKILIPRIENMTENMLRNHWRLPVKVIKERMRSFGIKLTDQLVDQALINLVNKNVARVVTKGAPDSPKVLGFEKYLIDPTKGITDDMVVQLGV